MIDNRGNNAVGCIVDFSATYNTAKRPQETAMEKDAMETKAYAAVVNGRYNETAAEM